MKQMAEVRKKVLEDKYGTSKIRKSDKKKEKKNLNKKVEEKSVKSNDKKGFFVRFRIFCHGVKSEFEKVHWPSKSDMVKYSISTIIFVIFCAVFFYAIDVIFAFIKSLF